MEVEELLRSYLFDGCVLMGGCDKTTLSLLMGAISMNLPAIYLPAGPMLRGDWNERPHARQRLGHMEILGGTARGQDHRGRVEGRGKRYRAITGPLHDDGHGTASQHDDQRR